jgi:hypothetical protein
MRQAPYLLLVVSVAVVGGCAAPASRPHQPLVLLDELIGQPVDVPAGTYRLLADKPTSNRFPCSIAIARLSYLSQLGQPSDNSLALQLLRHEEAAPWNELFDNLQAVSEVFPIGPTHVPAQSVTPADVVRAAASLHAGLCLIFSEGDVDNTGRQVVGALLESPTASILAVAKSDIFPYPGTTSAEDVPHPSHTCADLTPARLATKHFQQLMHQAIRQLIQLDQAAPATQPSPWSTWRATPQLRLYPFEP